MNALSADLSPANPAPAAYVDVTVANFKAEVLDPSRSQLVIVDFWASWCGPCKQLGPILEKIVAASKGAARLCKIDIDQSPQIAQQMRVQSVPAVFAFYNGQPVDGFMGALPESQIKSWLEQLIKATGVTGAAGDGLDTALKQAEDFLAQGDVSTAQSIYTDILSEHPDNAPAFAGALRCLLALGQTDQAAQILASAPPELATHKAVDPIHTALELAQQAAQAGASLADLEGKLAQNPNDHQARLDLAMALYAAQETARAMDELLEIVRRDRKWQDDGARKQLIKLFEALGPTHPDTIEGRKKLSSVLFS